MLQLTLHREPRSRARGNREEAIEPVIYRFDRRRSARREVKGDVTAVRREHTPEAYRHRLVPMGLENISTGGLAGRCSGPMDMDEPIAIHFPPEGSRRGFVLRGHVVRCEPIDAHVEDEHGEVAGYAIGVRFDPNDAA